MPRCRMELHDALTGLAGNGGVGRTYGRGMSLKPLVRVRPGRGEDLLEVLMVSRSERH